MASGLIHSIESMGLVDGPGIRAVVFLQGCNLRCKYCHNPDTWDLKGKSAVQMTTTQLVEKIKRYKTYFKSSGGGVTFSGGEPLLQKEFLIEALKLFKEENINTCIDTAGVGDGNYDEVLKYTDLILYDVKHYDAKAYKTLTGKSQDETNEFIKAVSKTTTPMWVRHVVVPGLTDGQEHIEKLKEFVKELPNVEKVQLLPYHKLGENKYKELEITYPLEGTMAMNEEKTKEMEDYMQEVLR